MCHYQEQYVDLVDHDQIRAEIFFRRKNSISFRKKKEDFVCYLHQIHVEFPEY